MMNLVAWLFRIVVFVILAIFASQNSQPIMLQYTIDQSIELPLSVVLLIFFTLGAFISMIFIRCQCSTGD
ncbi:LapA family protein [uncultured Nitrosomonas sp.]|uniref:LapA family protein n=1 Tax=uncultured Nitrosomonas sp. TaxID=156424 RepID=UPI00345AA784